jgi:ATP-dependent RNA helicase DDX47/RRP3
LNQKLPQYPADEETVLVLLERVSEAQRLAAREMRELAAQDPKNRKKQKRSSDDADAGGGGGGGGGRAQQFEPSAMHNQRGGDKSKRKNKK